jgi:hypothetical protein
MSTSLDRIDVAARALRESTAEPADGRASRDELLSRLVRREQRRRGYKLAGIVAAFVLVIPAASAGLIHWRKTPSETRRLSFIPPAPVRRVIESPTNVATGLAKDEVIMKEELSGFAPGPAVSQPSPSRRPGRQSSMPSAPSLRSMSSELDIYGRAHHLHFHGGSPGAALRAWTGYLEKFPEGHFLPEARFNRAVCLVRVGDMARAREELSRIVKDSRVDYQRAQAARLMAKLDRR